MVAAHATVDIAKVKARHPVGDVVEAAGIALRGKGRVRQGVCPFHEETEGSFTVYSDTERFYCFGCGAGGDVLDFVGRMEGLTLTESIRRLDNGSSPVITAEVRPAAVRQPAAPEIPPKDPALLTAAGRFYVSQLWRSQVARDYLASRGIGVDPATRLGLGYAPGHGLREHLQASGYGEDRIRASGLFLGRGAERFAGMITVPDMVAGRVGWLTARAIDQTAKPRFQALPGPKPVLGLSAVGQIPPFVVLTEGVFDHLILATWGYSACAALGTQGMDKVAAALRGCYRVFLAFDNDDAGRVAAQDLKDLLGRRAAVVHLPRGISDVSELANLPHGQMLFNRLLAQAARNAR